MNFLKYLTILALRFSATETTGLNWCNSLNIFSLKVLTKTQLRIECEGDNQNSWKNPGCIKKVQVSIVLVKK